MKALGSCGEGGEQGKWSPKEDVALPEKTSLSDIVGVQQLFSTFVGRREWDLAGPNIIIQTETGLKFISAHQKDLMVSKTIR